MDVSDRYDHFQQEAVNNIVADFKADPKGRFLLVIPTGGGKTTTAVKAVSALYDGGLLTEEMRVLWVVHRDELRTQAKKSFAEFAAASGKESLPGKVDICMLSELKSYLADNPDIRFAVIDEAHHVAARSYQKLFERPELGILGLTATPSRHDGQPLQFSRESYSIGFPDLVKMGVLLNPTVIKVQGGTYNFTDADNDPDGLEVLNNDERNSKILAALFDNKSKIQKAIIYVGTKNHARELYRLIKCSNLAASYESIGLILGGERRRYKPETGLEVADESRKDFIKAQKAAERAILINVDVLTEGYDDPTVNTVVMARPTSSKLVYMQALGRAVRIDKNNPQKAAYVLEVTDVLPNIRYRIDNRWLYSDISDQLEPEVIDCFYPSPNALEAKILDIFEQFHVPSAYRTIPSISPRDRTTMLLFKVYAGNGTYNHIPVIITNSTRQSATGFFNFLAARMKKLQGLNVEQVFQPVMAHVKDFDAIESDNTRKNIFNAMENAWSCITEDGEQLPELIKKGRSWITFVAFRLDMSEKALGEDILQFTADMLNRDSVRDVLRGANVDSSFILVKLPLPLRGTTGIFLTATEFAQMQATVNQLADHVSETDDAQQWKLTMSTLGMSNLPIEQRYIQSLPTIVRERLDYFRFLDSLSEGMTQ